MDLKNKGWYEVFSPIFKFKLELEETDLEQKMISDGRWILWRESERQLEQNQMIITLLQNIVFPDCFGRHYLLQFWRAVRIEGQNHHLSSLNYPFSVGKLEKEICWYRKLCRDHVYVVDVRDEDQDLVGVGGVGRAYRNRQPESTPDLRLHSTDEFPMRDEAARCGFAAYLALPLFLPHASDQCYGVLELLWNDCIMWRSIISTLDGALQIAGFRSTHTPISISGFDTKMQPDCEIKDMLELVMATVPRLYLAQVWVPCKQKQCLKMISNTTNLHCMEIIAFISCQYKIVNSHYDVDADINYYLDACQLHNLQIDLRCLDSGIDDLSISKNPLAHYAHKSRLSHSFAVSLEHVYDSNHLYFIQFFHQPKYRQDSDYSLQCLLLRLMEMNLKCFKFASEGGLVSEPQEPNAVECESTDRLNVMKSYKQKLSESNFATYLEMVDKVCLRPSPKDRCQGWVFGTSSNSLLVPLPIKEKIEAFMNNIKVVDLGEYWIIQFWASKLVEGRCYLEALDQPYVVGCLSKGLASFRKKCMMHSYFVDDKAKLEELGPPGRVFRNGHPEISPDLFHYTTKEYPIRNNAMHCCTSNRGYFAFPIFEDEHYHKCVGVLEFVGFYHIDLEDIGRELEAAKLCTTHTDLYPRFLADELAVNIICREEALTELRSALELTFEIPQVYKANVWVSNRICASIHCNMSCLELALSTYIHSGRLKPTRQVQWIHVQTRKGMIGMVLASENKSCFCRNLCELSIVDQPLSHFEMSDRDEVYFATCLQSSHTGDLVYVVEFYLHQGQTTYEYLRFFLNILMPMMKHKLKSFKMASGKELGEELVVDVIEFCDANKLDSSESEQADVFPIRFKSVQYSQEEQQHIEEQQTEECSAVVEQQLNEEQPTDECSGIVELQHSEEQQTDECSVFVELQHSEAQQTDECRVFVELQHSEECSAVVEQQNNEEQPTDECSVVVELQHNEAQQTNECSVFVELQHSEEQENDECSIAVEHQHSEERQTEECSVVASDFKTRGIGKRKPGLHLTLEVLKSHFGKKLKDAAEELGIGKSTIKRACGGYGIDRWPSKAKYRNNPSFFERQYAQQDIPSSTSNLQLLDSSLHRNEPLANTEEKVIVKVKYEEGIIKLELSLSLGWAKLMEEVCTRINLEMGTFKLKYLDEDGDEILLFNDADLQLCRKSQIKMSKTYIQLLVQK